MNRREFIAGVGGTTLLPASARAQQKRTRPLVFFVAPGLSSDHAGGVDLFLPAMQEIGYEPERNYDFIIRYTEGRVETIPAIINEIATLQPDIIVALTVVAAIPLARQIKTIPIVALAIGADPVQLGLIRSWSHPGGNVSGGSNGEGLPGLVGKRLQLLIEWPNLDRIAVLIDPDYPTSAAQAARAVTAGRALGIDIRLIDLRYSDDVAQIFATIAANRFEALECNAYVEFNNRAVAIADLAIKYRLPAVYGNTNFISAGGLMIYQASLRDQYRRVASMVKKVLDGQSIATIPFDLPAKFDLTINLKTAKAIGITVPDTLLAIADSVIE